MVEVSLGNQPRGKKGGDGVWFCLHEGSFPSAMHCRLSPSVPCCCCSNLVRGQKEGAYLQCNADSFGINDEKSNMIHFNNASRTSSYRTRIRQQNCTNSPFHSVDHFQLHVALENFRSSQRGKGAAGSPHT